MLSKSFYTPEEIDKQMDYVDNHCGKCLHNCNGIHCKPIEILMDMAEKANLNSEQKKRYFSLVGG